MKSRDHGFGIRGFESVRNEHQGGQVIHTIRQDVADCCLFDEEEAG